jgi:hypothetical protein
VTSAGSFEDYLASLSPFVPPAGGEEPDALGLCQRATKTISALAPLNRKKLAAALAADPEMAPVMAAVAGLSQERFKTWLQDRFGTAGWVTLSRKRSQDLVDSFEKDFQLISLLTAQASRKWTWSDVLARTMAPRQRAGGSVQAGRALEDAVEDVVEGLKLNYEVRTRFTGKADRTAPADFAIPSGSGALIAVAVKGFDSTGSKLSDAAREIDQMVEVRTARQFIFAVVDGQGWLRRQEDLRRIHALWDQELIDGVYTRGQLAEFGKALRGAARRVGLLE